MIRIKKTKHVAAILSITAIPFSTACFAEGGKGGWFATGKLGQATVADIHNDVSDHQNRWEFSSDNNYALSLGYEMAPLSLAAEYSYRHLDAAKRICADCKTYESMAQDLDGSQIQHSLLIEGNWYPMSHGALNPFLGIGAGYTVVKWDHIHVDGEAFSINGSNTLFTYKLVAGVEVDAWNSASVLFAYNYLKTESVSLYSDYAGYEGKLDKQGINIIDLGIKYRF